MVRSAPNASDRSAALWLVYLALFAESTGSVLFRPAAQALTPVVVGDATLLSSHAGRSLVSGGPHYVQGPRIGTLQRSEPAGPTDSDTGRYSVS